MAEFTYNPIQEVAAGQSIILNTAIACPKGYVIHRNESGLVILRGAVNNPCGCFARYQVTFNGNIAVTDGGTAGPISVALAIGGEAIQTSKAIVTPAATDEYFNVTSTAIVTVPRDCCFNLTVENTSTGATPADVPPTISVQNANMTVTRIA